MIDGNADVRYASDFTDAEVDALEADLRRAGVSAVLQELDVRAGSALPAGADLVLALYTAGITVVMEETLRLLVETGVAAIRRHRPPPAPTPPPAGPTLPPAAPPPPAGPTTPSLIMRLKDVDDARELEVLVYPDGVAGPAVAGLAALMVAVFAEDDLPDSGLVFDPHGPSITPPTTGP